MAEAAEEFVRPARFAWTDWWKRIFAALLARFCPRYNRLTGERKRRMLGELSGTVLEIGPGTGANIPFLPAGIRLIGVEPNPFMHPYLVRAAAGRGIDLEIRQASAERLPVEDASVDAVVSTLVLCSVADQDGVLQEIRRVLKPGGRFIFLEHVAAPPGTRLHRLQRWLTPFWRAAGDGCNPGRDTASHIWGAGFETIVVETFEVPLPVVRPHIAGFAVKRGGEPVTEGQS